MRVIRVDHCAFLVSRTGTQDSFSRDARHFTQGRRRFLSYLYTNRASLRGQATAATDMIAGIKTGQVNLNGDIR